MTPRPRRPGSTRPSPRSARRAGDGHRGAVPAGVRARKFSGTRLNAACGPTPVSSNTEVFRLEAEPQQVGAVALAVCRSANAEPARKSTTTSLRSVASALPVRHRKTVPGQRQLSSSSLTSANVSVDRARVNAYLVGVPADIPPADPALRCSGPAGWPSPGAVQQAD